MQQIDTKDLLQEEREQAVNRLLIVMAAVGYLGFIVFTSGEQKAPVEAFLASLLSLAISVTFLLSTLRASRTSEVRKTLGVIHDVGISTLTMAISGYDGAPWIGVYLWIVFGNALRFGKNYLLLSTVLVEMGTVLLLVYNPFWGEHPRLAFGMMATFAIVPIYGWALVERLRRAQQKMAEAMRVKSEFTARMSHEMRTPLTTIVTATEMLDPEDLPPQARAMTRIIQEGAITLRDMVNNVLNLAKAESGKLKPRSQAFDLHGVFRSVHDLLSPEAKRKGIYLRMEVFPTVPWLLVGDHSFVVHILLNLASNAIRFTNKGGVTIRCCIDEGSCDPTEGKIALRFEVEDTGIGIPEDQLKVIEKPFEQASNASMYGGTGLGLSIVQYLVSLLGGKIRVHSEEGKGSRFSVLLPFRACQEIMDAEHLPVRGHTVLVINPEADMRLVKAETALQMWEMDVARAFSMEDIPNILAQHEYSPIIAAIAPWRFAKSVRTAIGDDIPLFLLGNDLFDSPRPYNLVTSERELYRALHMLHAPDTMSITAKEESRNTAGENDALRILVVDDNETNRILLSELLRKEGHHVTAAANAQEFLELASEDQYDLFLLDYRMPDLNGCEAYQLYQFHQAQSGEEIVPAILITADVSGAAQHECKKAGIARYLTKPIHRDTLLDIVQKVVERPGDQKATTSDLGQEEPLPLLSKEATQEILSMASDSSSLVHSLLTAFRQDAEVLLEQMRASAQVGDRQRLFDLAHALKGNAANMGMVRLMKEAEKLQKAVERHEQIDLVGAVNQLAELSDQSIRAFLRNASGQQGQGGKGLLRVIQ